MTKKEKKLNMKDKNPPALCLPLLDIFLLLLRCSCLKKNCSLFSFDSVGNADFVRDKLE